MRKVYNHENALQRALTATVPARTSSYTPIPHRTFLELLRYRLNERGFVINSQRMFSNETGSKLIGFYDVHNRRDEILPESDMTMSIGFRNSYDKSMRVGLAAGGKVIICENGVIMGDMLLYVKKHTGSVDEEVSEKMDELINGLESSYAKLNVEVNIFKNYEITRTQKAELLGRIYFEEELLTPHQLSIVKREFKQSEHFKGNTLWDLYNNITESLKFSHPLTLIDDHILLHSFMAKVAGILPVVQIVDAVEQPPVVEVPVMEMNEFAHESAEANAEVAEINDQLIESAAVAESPVEEAARIESEMSVTEQLRAHPETDEGYLTSEEQIAAAQAEERAGQAIDDIFTPEQNAGTNEGTEIQ